MADKRILSEGSPADFLFKSTTKTTGESVKVIAQTEDEELTEAEPIVEDKTEEQKPKRKKKNPKDKRTRRTQILLTPRIYEKLDRIAYKNRQSMNETIIQAITEYIERSK